MGFFDVFNGDADGICALQQLRLDSPADSALITGVKRDISLLKRVTANREDHVTVLDISLDKNRDRLMDILTNGASVRYFDHHFAGEIPSHANFTSHIDTAPDTCTSLIVNDHLNGQHARWAVVGAFGDNFDTSAQRAAQGLNLSDTQLAKLRELGICINYNAYGATIDDLHFPPDTLFKSLRPYRDPLDFIKDSDTFAQLHAGYNDDFAAVAGIKPETETPGHAVYILPADAWARRVSGVYANQLAQQAPQRAHAMLTRLAEGGFVVSVRAPLATKDGADALCRQFPTGGGRKAAAGINVLPDDALALFVDKFKQAFP